MAEDKMDQSFEEETNGGAEPSEQNKESSMLSQTQECLEAYIKNPLEGLIKSAKSAETIACIDYKGKINVQEYKLGKLLKSRDIQKEYLGIKNTISTTLLQQVCLVDENVDTYLAKTQAISDALNSSLDAIKNAKTKLWEIRECACKLDAVRNDSCNSEQLSAMSKIPKGDPDDKSGITRFQALVDAIVADANSLYDSVDDTFEKGVKVAGIQAYMNTNSLKEFSVQLKTDAEAFDADIDASIGFADEQISAAQTDFTKGLQALDTCLFAKNTAHIDHVSLEDMKTYIPRMESESCDIDRTEELERICSTIKSVFQSGIECKPS